MLSIGIIVMVGSVVVGVIALSWVVLTSSGARDAGRRVRIAMALSDPEGEVRPAATEAEEPPRWILALLILSGAGLVLGLLMVMIASIP